MAFDILVVVLICQTPMDRSQFCLQKKSDPEYTKNILRKEIKWLLSTMIYMVIALIKSDAEVCIRVCSNVVFNHILFFGKNMSNDHGIFGCFGCFGLAKIAD